MRHPMIYASESSFGDGKRTGEMKLDLRELDQLVEKAAEEIEAAELRQQREAEGWLPPNPQVGYDKTYAHGVRAALAWLAGHHADDRLTELLGIDEDQR